jgi:hypothetical protein
MIDLQEHAQSINEAKMLLKVFFGKEVYIRVINRDYRGGTIWWKAPFIEFHDERRKVGKGSKTFVRRFCDTDELVRYVKRVCSSRNKNTTSTEITAADRARIETLKTWLQEQKTSLHPVGHIYINGDLKGYTATGSMRRPFQHRSDPLDCRSFSTIDALEEHLKRYLKCCISTVDYQAIGDMNQLLLKNKVNGRMSYQIRMDQAPTFNFNGDRKNGIPPVWDVSLEEALKQANIALTTMLENA